MSRRVPYFLERLSLDLDADLKTIRRAYARELKLIDQEQDLPGFQSLRETYEAALDWAKHNQPAREPDRQPLAMPKPLPEPAPEPVTVLEVPKPVAFVRIPVPEAVPAPVTLLELEPEPVVLHEPEPEPEPVLVLAPEPVVVPVVVPPEPAVEPEPIVTSAAPEPDPAPPEPVVPPVKPQPDVFIAAENPHALAETVFAKLMANTARIVELGMLKDATLLETELRNRLADEELFNITARNLFEARVAYLLFSEYTLEAGVLFGAAATVFGWEKDSRRLQPFGEAGAFLDRAIIERTMFQRQDAEELVKQRGVMARLREGGRPPIAQIRRDMAYLERMLTRFPNLMTIMVSRDTVEQWRSQYEASPPAAAPTKAAMDYTPEPVLAGYSNKRRFDGAWIFIALVAAFYIWFIWNRDAGTPSYEPSATAESSQYPSYAPGADPSAPDYNPSAQSSQYPKYAPGADPATRGAMPPRAPRIAADKFDQRIVDAIVSDVKYTPTAKAPYGKRTVVYDILTADNGHIYGVNRLQRSIDPDYDEAVKAAILHAKPLPTSYGSPVRLLFSVDWKKEARRTKAPVEKKGIASEPPSPKSEEPAPTESPTAE